MELLNCGKNKAVKIMQELDDETGIGLIEKKRQGFGKANIIYVKNFVIEDIVEEKPLQEFTNQTSGDKVEDTEVYKSNFMKFTNQTSRIPKNKPLEVYFSNPNNNKYNNTYKSNTESNLIPSVTQESEDDTIRCDEMEQYYILEETVKQNIDYDVLLQSYPNEVQLVQGIYQLFNVLLNVWCKETAYPSCQKDYDYDNDPTYGQCAITASLVYDLFDGTIYKLKVDGGGTHYFNKINGHYEEFIGNRQYKNRMLNSIIDAFFITLLRNHGANVIVPSLAEDDQNENLIFILKYIQEHFATVTLKELSSFFNYSERQLQRIIKSSTGMSFSENIQQLRMNQTTRLLTNPDISIAVISEELGYSDIGNFRQAFKKCFGMTPLEYHNKTR